MVDPSTVLLLPGQGAQRERMAAGLFGTEPVFTARMTELFDALGPDGARLRAAWLRSAPAPALDDAATAQPLLLAVGYALGRAVGAAVGAPDLLLGHSAGELAAAALAGVFPADGLSAEVVARSRDLGHVARGGMLAVAAAPEDLIGFLDRSVAVAAVNGPRQTVLAGPSTELGSLAARLRETGITVRPLRSGHAFHSPAMRPVARRFARALAALRPGPPRTPVLSSRTSTTVTAAEARDPGFWAGQLALPVRFWPALKTLLDQRGDRPGLVLLDASADRSLSAGGRHPPAVRHGNNRSPPPLGANTGGPGETAAFTAAMDAVRSIAARSPLQTAPPASTA